MDESDCGTLKTVKMGADNNPSATSRLVYLQTRKQILEENIAAKTNELRRLCIQEAELTGIMPAEIPLEPGEIIPTFRRRVGTTFEYPENIINSLSNEDESVQRKIMEATQKLVNNATNSKLIKRKNMSLYRQKKQQLEFENLKLQGISTQVQSSNSVQNQQLKQKKKPRPLLEADTISTKSSIPSLHEELNITRSSQSTSQSDQNVDAERYILTKKYNTAYKNYNSYIKEDEMLHNVNIQNYHFTDDGSTPTLNRLSITSNYINDRHNTDNRSRSPYMQTSYSHSHSNPNIYQQHPHISNTHTLPHLPHISPNQHQNSAASHPNINFPIHAHTLQYPNSRARCLTEETSRKYVTDHYRNGYTQDMQYPYYSSHSLRHMIHKSQHNYKNEMEPNTYNNAVNYHHILAHQQYEPDICSAGLGGNWVKNENGETVWCPTVQHDDSNTAWQADKRFGSLDRRKAKYTHHKRTSPNLEVGNKCIIRSVVDSQQELIARPITLQTLPISARSSRHDRQLVRTQSLGSVGAHTVDSVWPSDDNSSYDSDGHSTNELNASSRKLKQKGWCETSLDGPVVQTLLQQQHSVPNEEVRSSSQTQMPIVSSHSHVNIQSTSSPRTSKSILEIPAESNPSPVKETNIEIYNNNVLSDLPKNCTVVQAGKCKPYREVTKPFEMSDFYKYSTKFRTQDKLPIKTDNVNNELSKNYNVHFSSTQAAVQRHETEETHDGVYQKGVYQPLQPMKCQPLSPTNNNRNMTNIASPENTSTNLDSSLTLHPSASNVAEHFIAEMNAWYPNPDHVKTRVDANNPSTSPTMGRSTATLV